ncbi:hypothetical protein PSV08DRAFT_274409 [Bipolaris maydis]|nr:hypothetical protein J3E73DRAFT_269025 [Bipolaris maydis]KAJ6273468.1 hypothetical protein PSV08DRAFT_274409 [Bipolaris maydis]KAJ6284685.1 hypothetical protein J3E71DRAFT_266760 [Bipolaris maydis]
MCVAAQDNCLGFWLRIEAQRTRNACCRHGRLVAKKVCVYRWRCLYNLFAFLSVHVDCLSSGTFGWRCLEDECTRDGDGAKQKVLESSLASASDALGTRRAQCAVTASCSERIGLHANDRDLAI